MIKVIMHSHHKVKYDEYILKKAIEEVTNIIDKGKKKNKKGAAIKNIFSLKTLNAKKPCSVGKFRLCLLTDDDLIHMLKSYMNHTEAPHAKEWVERKYHLKAVWKTFADYKFFLKDFTDDEYKIFLDKKDGNTKENGIIADYLNSISLKEHSGTEKFYIIQTGVSAEYRPILTPEIKIFIKEEIVDLSVLQDTSQKERTKIGEERSESYFLLYFPKELCSRDKDKDPRENFIKFAKEKVQEKIKQSQTIEIQQE
jgi:hypothetical protein